MNGKDLEKALLWEAPHIGEKAPEQIPEAQNLQPMRQPTCEETQAELP